MLSLSEAKPVTIARENTRYNQFKRLIPVQLPSFQRYLNSYRHPYYLDKTNHTGATRYRN